MMRQINSMQTTYKGCIYKYSKTIGYDGKPDPFGRITLEKATPIDPSNKTIYCPATLDGKEIGRYNYGITDKGEHELIVEEGISYFCLSWYSCKLTGLVLPKSLATFYSDTFKECRIYLKKIVVDKDNPIFDSRNNSNCLIETKTNKLIMIGVESVIPNTVNEIGLRVFEDRKDLEHLVIPPSVTIVGQEAFRGCHLPSDFVLPHSIKKIESDAFFGATGITELNLPNVESIEYGAFGCTPISKISFGDKLKTIGEKAFSMSCIEELTLPDSITGLHPNAFAASNIKRIYCSEKVAAIIAKTKASKKIKIIINGQKTTVGDLLNKPDNVFDLDACIKNRKDNYAKNINIDMIIEYGSSYDGDMLNGDGYNYGDYKDTVMGTLQAMPAIDASSFNKEILTFDDGRETVLHTLSETFEYGDVYTDYLSLMDTNIFKYLKYQYDKEKDVYYITGVKNIRSIGYLALGFGKEKIIINSKAFDKRNIVNVHIGPNVIAIMEDAFPSLKDSIVSICEGVDYIGPHALTFSSHGYIKYGGDSIPTSWSNKWNQHNRTFYRVCLKQKGLELSSSDIKDKVDNYKKYSKVKWDNEYQPQDDEALFQYSINDRNKLIKMISSNNRLIEKMPEQFKNDPQIFLAACSKNPANFQYAGSELKKNKEFILNATEYLFRDGDSIIPYIDSSLFDDLDFMVSLINNNPRAVKFLGKKIRDNKSLWLTAIDKDHYVIEELKGPLRKDAEFAREVIHINGFLLRNFAPEIRNNKELIIEAIKSNGSALAGIDKSLGLNDDIEIVKLAVSSNSYSIKYASERLQKNEELALLAVKSNPSCIDDLHKDLLKNKQFILKAMSVVDKPSREFAFELFMSCADDSLLNDKGFIEQMERLAN